MLSASALRDYIDYTAWASQRLVEAASQLPAGELTRDFGTADKSVLGTLVHIYAGDRIWLARVEGNSPPASFVTEADYQVPVLQKDWPAVHEKWRRWAAARTDETAGEEITYQDLRGNHWRQPAWQIVLHVVNHGTHHRGQVAGFLRSLGHAPPPIDLTVFYRARAKVRTA